MNTRELLKSLPNNPILGAVKLCAYYRENVDSSSLDDDIELFYLFKKYCKAHSLDLGPFPALGPKHEIARLIQAYFDNLFLKMKETEAEILIREIYQDKTDQFSEKNIEDIQIIINQLRDFIAANKRLDEDHKRRLLQHVNELQTEFNRPVSNFDILLGKISRIGVEIGNFGENSKIYDMLRQLFRITEAKIVHKGLPEPNDKPQLPFFERADDTQ